MKVIQEKVHEIASELHDAEHYAGEYLLAKSEKNTSKASTYKSMAEAELDHAMNLHKMATDLIAAVPSSVEPTPEMRAAWDHAHSDFTAQYDKIRKILA